MCEDKRDYQSLMRTQGRRALIVDAESAIRKCYEEIGEELPEQFKDFHFDGQVEHTFHRTTEKLVRIDVNDHHICFMEFADKNQHESFIGRTPE